MYKLWGYDELVDADVTVPGRPKPRGERKKSPVVQNYISLTYKKDRPKGTDHKTIDLPWSVQMGKQFTNGY